MNSIAIPPVTNEDRVPHDLAVWRTGPCNADGHRQICVDYGGGLIARTYVQSVPDWAKVVTWRFGWPPRD